MDAMREDAFFPLLFHVKHFEGSKTMNTESIGARCKAWRESKGVTQAEIAAEIGCTRQNIFYFEHGRNNNYLILLWYLSHGMPLKYICSVERITKRK